MENNLRKLRKSKNWTLEYAAKLAGTTNQHLSRLETGTARLNVDWIEKFSEIYKIDASEILNASQKPFPLQKEYPATMSDSIPVQFGPDTIPILGHANGSNDAVMLNTDSEIGRALRHPNQQGMKGAFALYACGESMTPRYMPGELVYAASKKPPIRGQDCIIELNNGEGYLKQFDKIESDEVLCKQLNPAKTWKRQLSDVKAIHAIVGRG